jgi:uncharacterized protein (DUF2062 family)
MGIVPLWGFQMIVAIAVALYFRLNKILVLIAANISIPPMIPLIIYASHETGKIWMGDQARSIDFDKEITLETIQQSLMQYFLGACTLSVVCGIVALVISYSILRIFRK